MRNNIIPFALLIAVFCCTYALSSCNDDDKETFVVGDTTELRKELAIAYDSLGIATPDKYSTAVTEEFQSKLDLISEIIDSREVSAQEVINLTVNLDKAFTTFLNSRMEGIPDEYLLAGWGFDEGTGTTLTSDGTKKLVATLKGGASEIFETTVGFPEFINQGINGKAIYLNNGAHLSIENYNPNDFLGKQLTISAWLRPDVMKGGNYVVSLNYWENWKFQIQEQGKAYFTIKTLSGVTDSDNERDLSVPTKTWTHVVVVLNLDESTLSFYINGILTKEWTSKEKPSLVGSQASAYQSPLGVQLPLLIGTSTTYEQAQVAWNWQWNTPQTWDYFQGAMDEIKFYNTAISRGQVQWLYNKEAAELESEI